MLQLHTIAPWNRAVGRVLDAGPSQLHAMYALYQLNRYRGAPCEGEDNHGHPLSLDELSAILAEAICKMKTGHIEVVCLLILGVTESRVEELRSLFVCNQFVSNNDASVAPLCAGDAHFLLNALLLAINRSDERSGDDPVKSARPVRTSSVAARRAVTGTDESSASLPFDKDHCSRFIVSLLQLAPAVHNLPAHVQQMAFSVAFGDPLRMDELLPVILTNESIAPAVAEDIFTAIVVHHRDLCALLSGRAASPSNVNVSSYLISVWHMKVQELTTTGLETVLKPAIVFSDLASALRSLLTKASVMLNESEKKDFQSMVIASLAQFTAGPSNKAKTTSHSTGLNLGSVTDIVLRDEAAWLDSGLFAAYPECFLLHLALFVLTFGLPESGELCAARLVLLTRCLVAELTTVAAAAVHPWRNVRLVCSTAVGVLGAADNSITPLTNVDLSDATQIDAFLRSSLTFVALQTAPLQADMTRHIVSLHRLCCAASSQPLSVSDMPVAAHLLQDLLSFTPTKTHKDTIVSNSDPDRALTLNVTIMESLVRSRSFDLYVEFMLLDMPVHHETTFPEWRRDARIVALVGQLPAGSAWQRQVTIISFVISIMVIALTSFLFFSSHRHCLFWATIMHRQHLMN